MHLIVKDIESYGLISVTEQGESFLSKPWPVKLVEDRVFSQGTDADDDEDNISAEASKAAGSGGDTVLLSMLKDLRKDIARKEGLQPWIVFSDPSLSDMSIQYPLTVEELRNCQGVGEGKARKFGEPFLKLIKAYVEENEILRPEDYVVKSPPNKSAVKVFIIQKIDARMDLEDIAQAKSMDMIDLLEEIETIVSTGTKLNLNYYINKHIDEEVVEEICEYFRSEAESDSLNDALAALGEDYEEMEIRLVRVKFLCEVAS